MFDAGWINKYFNGCLAHFYMTLAPTYPLHEGIDATNLEEIPSSTFTSSSHFTIFPIFSHSGHNYFFAFHYRFYSIARTNDITTTTVIIPTHGSPSLLPQPLIASSSHTQFFFSLQKSERRWEKCSPNLLSHFQMRKWKINDKTVMDIARCALLTLFSPHWNPKKSKPQTEPFHLDQKNCTFYILRCTSFFSLSLSIFALLVSFLSWLFILIFLFKRIWKLSPFLDLQNYSSLHCNLSCVVGGCWLKLENEITFYQHTRSSRHMLSEERGETKMARRNHFKLHKKNIIRIGIMDQTNQEQKLVNRNLTRGRDTRSEPQLCCPLSFY